MPQPCSVCHHPDRNEIDKALAAGGLNRRLAAQFGLKEGAIRRHRAAHLSPVVARAAASAEAERAGSLVEQVLALQSKTLELLARAEQKGETRNALLAVRELARLTELLTHAYSPSVLEKARTLAWIESMSDKELDQFILAGGDVELARAPMGVPGVW
jgi:hypothetical protein